MLELINELFTFLKEIVTATLSVISAAIGFAAGSLGALHTEMPRTEGFLFALLVMWIISNKENYFLLKKMFIPIDMIMAAAKPFCAKIVTATKTYAQAALSATVSWAYKAAGLPKALWGSVVSKLKSLRK